MHRRLLVLPMLLLAAPLAAAEGSRDLLGSGSADYRAYMETGYGGGTTAGVARKTTLYVYAQNGERLALGSSALSLAASSSNLAAINVYTLTGTSTLASYNAGSTTTSGGKTVSCGVISTRAQEALGPSLAYSGGYTACTYAVTTTQLYRIEFLAPASSGQNPTSKLVTDGWTVATSDATVAAWDVSVLNTNNAEQKGRAYAKYMSLNTGGNGISETLNVTAVTRDGYQYKVRQNIDPYGYIFFANNKGYITAAGGNPSYTSVAQPGSLANSPAGDDTSADFTAKLFLNTPSSALPTSSGGEWLLPSSATLPPTPTNLTFTGKDGTGGYAGSASGGAQGGTFTFTNPGSGSLAYRLTIPLSSNGSSTDRVLIGTAASGSNTVTWDGLDGSGNAVPAGSNSYAASVKLFGGEIHFPLLDVENSTGGLTIQRVNPAGTVGSASDGNPYQIYWNDSGLAQTGTPSSPQNPPAGADSTNGTHKWGDGSGGGFGNNNLVDSWAYYPSGAAANGNSVVIRSADIAISKTTAATGAPIGKPVKYTLSVNNKSSTPGTVQATVSDPLPSWGSAMSWTCASGCAATSGSGSLSTLVSFSGTTAVIINVSVTVSSNQSAGTSVTNTASSTKANDAADPDTSNNSSSVALTTRTPTSSYTLTKAQRNLTTGGSGGAYSTGNVSAKPGDHVQYQITFTVTGDRSYTAATLGDTLPSALTASGSGTLTCPSGSTSSVTASGQGLSVDLVKTCGNLNPGDSGTLVVETVVK